MISFSSIPSSGLVLPQNLVHLEVLLLRNVVLA